MGEWKECKLQDVAEKFAMGPFGSNIKAENFVSSGVPVIRGANLNYNRYVDGEFVFLTEEKADELKSSNCYPGDLVFTHRGTIGQVGLIPEGKYPRYVVSQSGMKVTVNKSLVDSHYLFYFFKSSQGQHELLQHESQVGVPSISNPLTSLKSVNLLLPALPEQRAIASMLSSLDDKIDLLHRQNKTLEAIAETLFRQWFVEEADEGWEIDCLGNLIELQRGISYNGRNLGLNGEGLPMHNLNSVDINGSYKYSGIKYYTGEIKDKQILKAGDLLIINTDITPDNRIIGWPIFIPDQFTESVCSHHLYSTKLVSDKVSKVYLFFLLRHRDFRDVLASASNGTTVSMLSKEAIMKIEVRIPPKEKRKMFEEIVSKIIEKQSYIYKNTHILEKLRDTLLPKLMSGEVRVDV